MRFPNRLREVRERRGKTQEQLGELVGHTASTVSRIELGELRLKAYQLVGFARALECGLAELLPVEETAA